MISSCRRPIAGVPFAIACLWCSLMSATAWGQVFNDGAPHVVNAYLPFVDVFNGGSPNRPTTLTVAAGANISFLDVWQTSIADARGGEISHVFMYDGSQFLGNGTHISHVNLYNSSTGEVHSGLLEHFRAYDQSRATIHGGEIGFLSALGLAPDGGNPAPFGHSEIDVFGGDVGLLRAAVGGVVNMYGGTVSSINPFDGGTSNIHGGTLNDMTLNPGTLTRVFGHGFDLTFNRYIFDTPEYRLTGTLSEGSPINCPVLLVSGAVLRLVPEPASIQLGLFSVVAVGCVCNARRRRPPGN